MQYSKGQIKMVILARMNDGDLLIEELKKLARKDLDLKTGLNLLKFI